MIRQRLERLRAEMNERDLDAFLSLKLVNTYYFSGFTSLDTARPTTYTRPIAVIVDQNSSSLIVPVLDEEAAGASSEIRDIRCYSSAPADQAARDAVLERLLEIGGGRIGVEEDTLTAEWIRFFERHGDGLDLVFAGDIPRRLRMTKDDDELALLREASQLSDAAIEASVEASLPGTAEVTAETAGVVALRDAAAGNGDDSVVDAIPMVLAGARSSMPHEFTTSRPIAAGEVMWHCWIVSYLGYWVENIRTAVASGGNGDFDRPFEVLHEGLVAGQDATRPGATAGDVYATVMNVLHGAKLPDVTILNRSGHGMGLEYHEPPFIEEGDETELRPGMVVTIEPGLFYPGLGGLALSNTLVVSDGEAEVLTKASDELRRPRA